MDEKKTPIEAEAAGIETVTVTFNDTDFTFPSDPLDWPTKVMRAFEEGKAIACIQGLVGERLYQKAGIDDWPVRQTTALFEKFAEAVGLDSAGE